MSGFLLDTNVLSELERLKPSPRVRRFIRHTALDALFLSDVVLAEIRFGIETAAGSQRRDRLAAWLKDRVRPMFAGRILPITEDILLRWRWIVQATRRKGYTFDESDALLAATAMHHNLIVLTRDTEPFEQAEVACLNPWLPQ